ncbi:SusC/RagA family TonB-linked outer membrane protein [Sediminibacterium sp.]|uniref:SusC/RagA family TonB-linked outer membrane protein n=1 Tax=Sediminibacterium sp. TaxID=1917865 RepID=UPI002734AEE0|nr:SusC/RagA family TonB-linked outer membrane protein [Sediminibacterium sp.]MDP3393097.1 SusC/RagA family TonB-linked outer membrane protein [Sediminibacterium sp.]MDP3567699.1 SusC/RagA family TonB-linked outer membrane protein [Sediminibacterium sp.]
MRKSLTLLAFALLCTITTFAQTVLVQGQVTDDRGPVPNATVQEKGTKNITRADELGKFSFKVKQGSLVVVTAVGHAPFEFAATTGYQNVKIATLAGELEEVFVTSAFGVKKSQRTTPFSSQVINDEKLNVIRQPNLNNALAGKVAGVQFRGQSSAKLNDQGFLRIRGGGSLGDQGAIYIVDGTITNSFDINPDDVEDITVLKGANATALFGSRAGNGAIVITTKKGRAGKGIGVEVNQSTTFDKAAFMPNYQNEYGGGDGGWLTFTYNPTMPAEWQALNGKRYRDFTDDASWGPKIDGSEYIPWYAFIPGHSRSGKTASFTPQPNNARDFWNTGVTANTNVSFSQSNGAGQSLRVSYTNQNIKGMLPNTKSLRHNLNANFSMDLGSIFTIGANLTYTNQLISGDFSDGYANNSSGNFSQWFHRDLDINILKELSGIRTPIGTIPSWNFRRNPGSWSAAAPQNSVWAGNYWYNPYSYFENIQRNQRRDRLYGDVNLTVKFSKNLKFKGSIRKDQFNGNVENIDPNILQSSGGQTGVLASYATSNTVNNEWNFEGILSYNNTFGDFVVAANVGANRLNIRNRAVSMNTNQGLNVPGLYAIANSKAVPSISNARSDQQANSLFAFGDVEFRKYLSLTWAVRNDWFSTLPSSNNSLLSPSIGGAFVFSEFTKTALPWLNFGKAFASWGKKPKTLNPYALNLNYSVNPLLWGTNFLMGTPDGSPDANLRGALTTTWEAGLDLRFAKNKVRMNLTYYNENNRDEPLGVTVSGVSGFTSQTINAAWVSRSGLELELGVDLMKKKDFNWTVNTTVAYLLDNKVRALAPGLTSYTLAGGSFGTRFARAFHFVGEQWGMLRGGGIARNADGQPLITTNGFSGGLGWYQRDASKDWGSVVPKLTGGLQNFFSYKNFNVGLTFDYQFGGRFFSLSEQWGTFSGLLDQTAGLNEKGNPKRDPVSAGGGVRVTGVDARDGRTPVDIYVDAYDYFHQFYYQQIAEPFVHKLSYAKLRELSIGYSIPTQKLGKFGKSIQGASIALTGRNLFFIFRDSKNFDPSEISGVQGEDGQMPGARTIGFNVKVSF